MNESVDPIVYVDRSDIRPGAADELETAARRLVEHVEASRARPVWYAIHFSDDRSAMTVVHVHVDRASLERLMAAIAPMLPPFRDLLQLRSIDVYGSPGDAVIEQLESKVRLLGGTVTIHERVAGTGAGLSTGGRLPG